MRSALVLALLPAILAHNAAAEYAHVKHLRRSGGYVSHAAAARNAVALAERQGGVAGVTGAVGSVIGGTDPGDDTDGPSTAPTTARTTVVATTTTLAVNPPITTSSTSSRISSTSSGTLTSSPSVTGTASVSRSATASLNGTVSSTSASNTSTSAMSTSSSAQSLSMSVDPAGKTVVITQFLTASTSSSSSTSSSASADAGNADVNQKQNNSISTGAIIGIAVGVGAVIIALIACAVWRMRRRAMDEDDAIRWPELNRHGDATVHHALPARVTGKHGIETDPLERVASHNSDTYDHSSLGHGHSHGPTPMALNGSSFGAPSTLDYNAYDEKAQGGGYDWRGQGSYGGYPISDATVPTLPGAAAARGSPPDLDDDYTSFPPATTAATQQSGAAGLYESPSDDDLPHQATAGASAGGVSRSHSGSAGRAMAVANPDPVTFRQA